MKAGVMYDPRILFTKKRRKKQQQHKIQPSEKKETPGSRGVIIQVCHNANTSIRKARPVLEQHSSFRWTLYSISPFPEWWKERIKKKHTGYLGQQAIYSITQWRGRDGWTWVVSSGSGSRALTDEVTMKARVYLCSDSAQVTGQRYTV